METLSNIFYVIGQFCFGAVAIIATLGSFGIMFYYYLDIINSFELGKFGVTMLTITYIVICIAASYQTYMIARYVLS